MRIHFIIPFTALVITSCAPSLQIVDRYSTQEKKTVELVKGKGEAGKVVKRIEYYPRGKKKSEVAISLGKKDGKYFGYHESGTLAVRGKYSGNLQSGKWTWTGMAGEIDSIHNYINGQFHGKTIYYKEGEIRILKEYEAGKLSGKFVEYYSNENKKVVGNYLGNLPHDQWLWRNDDKSKARLIHFRSGIKHGKFKVWNAGILNLSGEFNNDQKTGTWRWSQSKKQLDSLATYVNGVLNGEYKVWHRNGERAVVGVYSQGKYNGEWKWWSEDENLDSLKTFKDGRLHGLSEFYYRNGQLKLSTNYESHKLDGEVLSYFAFGEIKSKTTYLSGEKNGPYEIWSNNARLEEKGSFANDQLHGQIQRWYSNGVLASIADYDEGIFEGLTQIFTLSNSLKRELFYEKGIEIARIEYHDNGRLKRVLIFNDGETLYERKWNLLGVEETEEKYILGTKLDSEFYLSGFLKYECIYKNGQKHGMEWWFNAQHNPTKVNLYYLGKSIVGHELVYETSE